MYLIIGTISFEGDRPILLQVIHMKVFIRYDYLKAHHKII